MAIQQHGSHSSSSPVQEELLRRVSKAHDPVEDRAEGQRDEEDVRNLGNRVPDGVSAHTVHGGRLHKHTGLFVSSTIITNHHLS